MAEASAAKSKPKRRATRASRGTQGVDELQREHAAAQADYAQAMSDGLASLNRRSVEAQVELAEAVRELMSEAMEGEQQTARTFPERLQEAVDDPKAREKVEQSYQAYVDAARELMDAQTDAQQRAADAYQAFVTAVQLGEPEEEVRRLGEETQEAYLEALRAAGPGDDRTRAVQEAAAACERTLSETQRDAFQKMATAISDGSTETLAGEREIAQRYEDAVRRYYETVLGVTEGTQRALLESQIRALRELQAGWAAIAEGSEDGPAKS